MTYREARVYLDEMSKYGSVLGLDTIRGLLRELGNPQDDLKFIHIAGTNGKGSVLAYTSTILSEAGYKIGRYVSPTVVSYLERIQIDGKWITETEFAELTEDVKNAIARLEAAGEPAPTVFETETAIAFLYFKRKKCDLAVVEAGLGGALDATNILKNTVCAVFSSISRDHLGVIGNTLEEIGENKAGIIKKGCAVVTAQQKECVAKILKSRAKEQGARYCEVDPEQMKIIREDYRGIWFSYKEFRKMHISMAGSNQPENAATGLEVIRTLERLGFKIGMENVRRGLERTVWPGRFECIGESPVFILDGAHNEDAARKLADSVKKYFPGRRLIGIMGVFRDKEYEKMARIMGPLLDLVYAVPLPDQRRGLPPEKLAEALSPWCPRVEIPEQERAVAQAVNYALSEAKETDVILAFGSLSYLHQVKEAYRQAETEALESEPGPENRPFIKTVKSEKKPEKRDKK